MRQESSDSLLVLKEVLAWPVDRPATGEMSRKASQKRAVIEGRETYIVGVLHSFLLVPFLVLF